jgi:Fe-S-cluster containining protein
MRLEVDPEEVELFLPKLKAYWLDLFKKKRRPHPSWQKKLTALWEAEAILNKQYLQEHNIHPACQAHCSACCLQPVLCLQMEVEMIVKWLNKKPDRERRQVITQIVDRVGRQTYLIEKYHLVNVRGPEAVLAISNLLFGQPCPFLLQSGLCAIYPVRPVECRTARSTIKCEWREDGRHFTGKSIDTPVDAACKIITDEIQVEIGYAKVRSLLLGWLVSLAKQIKT